MCVRRTPFESSDKRRSLASITVLGSSLGMIMFALPGSVRVCKDKKQEGCVGGGRVDWGRQSALYALWPVLQNRGLGLDRDVSPDRLDLSDGPVPSRD